MNTSKKIGIVTVLYNSDDVLPGFFESLSQQLDIDYKLYVIDNSPSNSGTILSENLAQKYNIPCFCLFNNANVGVAKGNNQGIELALKDQCDYILLANNDTEFNSTAIASLRDAITQSGDSLSTSKIMYFDQPEKIWYAGGKIDPWLMRTPHFGILDVDRGQFDQQDTVDYAPTCFMMVDKKVFEDVGLMDEKYFVYYDDSDFVFRARQKGYNIRFVPQSLVLHKVSSSTGGGSSPFSIYYTNRNKIYFIRKNLKGFNKIFTMSFALLSTVYKVAVLNKLKSNGLVKAVADGFKV